MIKNYIHSAIIVLTQTLLPILVLVIAAPWFINSNLLQQWQRSLADNQLWFLILHGLFYLGLVFLWPKLIIRLQTQSKISIEQLNLALKVRWYLLSIFLFMDTVMLWRMT
ncbi:hypothetical protein [Legionella maceachernii]|uniref:Uncharacterized protein n=1 Tax=Legionella maceachernii TaxID=466 RepID=A0A0W0VZK1_9GAMM|nr:hypothetical protein [Legionella maceachernii]KTD25126.1 hypothetical protein Lmac_2104 [Legionella maceachernii]SKA27526.1 hypothetical protein SAMN02745128_02984 [Legionella maceachernii]SUP04666.1 Uncharacterised protein [Legionella maceachernii]